ncbi:Predicted membrane protein [uncultured Clostridium sp.]|uniref:Gx transporter family protein n=1 Tax=Muricoprocola aceti TaxID=2981772 RepID=A0ABT2SKY1_9FIRM|nr:Gx transporter family protein [Muricoprocola aceti]MCU6725144.1 Gx transporter family protein [Muricoprocola aceti]SCH41107.1 Predicted membrane protein [uncultured Clostridium sp.]
MKKKSSAQKVALYGVLIALAMVLSYVEMLIPLPVGIPGVKPGLANLVVFLALYTMTAREALLISMVRILLVSITFGNGSAFLYSMAGGILSFLVMWIFQKNDFLLPAGVSIAGGIAHNVGQLLMAAVILENGAVFTYFPVLLAAGCITGGIIGFLGEQIRKRIIRA